MLLESQNARHYTTWQVLWRIWTFFLQHVSTRKIFFWTVRLESLQMMSEFTKKYEVPIYQKRENAKLVAENFLYKKNILLKNKNKKDILGRIFKKVENPTSFLSSRFIFCLKTKYSRFNFNKFELYSIAKKFFISSPSKQRCVTQFFSFFRKED